MAAGLAVRTGKGGHKSVPTPGIRPSFVLGSRPETLRAAPVPRIKPNAASTRDYAKVPPPSNDAGFGTTGDMSGLS